jgi:hypothetical protein
MDLTTNNVIITDAIRSVEINKEKLMSEKEDDKESNETDYNEDAESEKKEEEETREIETTTNQPTNFFEIDIRFTSIPSSYFAYSQV